MIGVEGLVKTYGFRETTLAVDHVSFSVPKGARFGFLGSNDAGKSTVLRILATILRPTEGQVTMGGHDALAERALVRKLVGYMPQDVDLRDWPSGTAYLRFWARVSGLSPDAQAARIAEAARFLGLGPEIEVAPKLYTIDVQRRLSLAQALLTDPAILLLDEPLTGVGDAGRRFFVERFNHLIATGKTIVLSSPLLADIRAACDQVAVMSGGRIRAVLGIEDLLQKIGVGRDARVFIEADGITPDALAALKGFRGVVDVRTTTTATIVYVTPTEVDVQGIRHVLESRGIKVRNVREARLQLGDVFSALNA